jgi:uncharacterized protein involved in response to NO
MKSTPDPYRLFFPLGILLGLAGVAIWPLNYFGIITGYWGMSHAFIQADGFLFCFIAGFLLTALPRFTSTEVPGIGIQATLALVVLAGSIAMELQQYSIGQTLFAISYAILFALAAMRFAKRKGPLPPTFMLVGLGILAAFIAAIINALTGYNAMTGGWPLVGKRMLTEGMTLLLVLGVGGFLGPRLLGFDRLTVVQIGGVASPLKRAMAQPPKIIYTIAGILVLLSIIFQYAFELSWMSIIRAAIVTAVMAVTLEPWKAPQTRTTLAWCVWVSNLFTILGVWLVALFPTYYVDFLHVLFIGGFSLLILAVGMRVTLSHGGHGLASEKKNWPLRIGLICGSIALLARAGAPFSPNTMSEHLMMAGILWLIGLGVWGWRLTRLILTVKLKQ